MYILISVYFRNLKLSTTEAVIITRGPEAVRASFTANLDSLVVTFDKNIQSSQACSDIFDANSSALILGKAIFIWTLISEIKECSTYYIRIRNYISYRYNYS